MYARSMHARAFITSVKYPLVYLNSTNQPAQPLVKLASFFLYVNEIRTVSDMEEPSLQIPHTTTMQHAANLGISQDRPIMLDYYSSSIQGECRLVKTQEQDTILYKNDNEYTSPLRKVFQIDGSTDSNNAKDIICISENSIYIVHSTILQNAGGDAGGN